MSLNIQGFLLKVHAHLRDVFHCTTSDRSQPTILNSEQLPSAVIIPAVLVNLVTPPSVFQLLVDFRDGPLKEVRATILAHKKQNVGHRITPQAQIAECHTAHPEVQSHQEGRPERLHVPILPIRHIQFPQP